MTFDGKFIMLGYGSLGPNTAWLLKQQFPNNNVVVLTDIESTPSHSTDIQCVDVKLDSNNYQDILNRYCNSGDFVINLTVDVSCADLITWCQSNEVLYIDTALYNWLDNSNQSIPLNYFLRKQILHQQQPTKSTAVITHGANPGLVNHFVKYAIDQLSNTDGSWSEKAQSIGLQTIHISEVDTQWTNRPNNPNDFFNTWSIQGFINEARMPAELTVGTHESFQDIKGYYRSDRSGALSKPGAKVKVRSWNPCAGQYDGWMITHCESISIGQLLSDDKYSPSVYYVYRPIAAAITGLHDWIANDYSINGKRVLLDETNIKDGKDYLGVLLMSKVGTVWCGNILSAAAAAESAPYANATTLQVTAPLLAAIHWAIANPSAGIVEADDIDYNFILSRVVPLIGRIEMIDVNWPFIANKPLTLNTFLSN